MASLTNTKIKDTYDGLLKTTDNDALGGTYKLITDGLGNSSGLYLGTGGNVGIGTGSTVDDKLHILGDSVKIQQFGQAGITFKFNHGNNSSSGSDVNYSNIKSLVTSGNTNFESGALTFETRNSGTTSERMRIDSSGNVGIGISSGMTYPLTVQAASGNNSYIHFVNSTTGTSFSDGFQIGVPDGGSDALLFQREAANMKFYTSATERMRITSSGDVALHETLQFFDDSSTPSASAFIHRPSSNTLALGTNSSEAMRIDSSGRVGVNVSSLNSIFTLQGNEVSGQVSTYLHLNSGNNDSYPFLASLNNTTISSANYGWTFNNSSTNGNLEIGRRNNSTTSSVSLAIERSTGNVGIGTSSPDTILEVVDENPILTVRDTSTGLSSANAALRLAESGSGDTLDNYWDLKMKPESVGGTTNFAIANSSLGEVLNINYQGNVGIGTTSPDHKLHLEESDTTSVFLKTENTAGSLLVGNNSSGNSFVSSQTSGKDLLFETANSEKMRITSSGNIGIGRSSNINAKLSFVNTVDTNGYDVGTMRFYDDGGSAVYGIGVSANQFNLRAGTSSDGFAFWAGTSQRMRIDSSGRLGLGTTSVTNSRLQIKGANNTTNAYSDGLKVTSNNETIFTQYNWNGINGDTGLSFATGGTERMRIESDGGIFAYNLLASTSVSNPQIRLNISTKELYYQSSSLRYKEEVENLDSQIDKLMNLRTVKFKVKGTNEDATGLIAEEVAEVIPELTFKNEVEGFDEPQIDGVSYGDLPTYLLKAIQEQQEMINELKSEIKTLKSQINS